MQGIKRIHYNSIGIVFQWEHDLINNNTDSYQVIIKNVGFYLLKNELKTFVDCIEETKSNPCNHCMKQTNCGTFLLRTAVEKVDVAVSKTELFFTVTCSSPLPATAAITTKNIIIIPKAISVPNIAAKRFLKNFIYKFKNIFFSSIR
mgnify:CR=1 FL=1